MKRLVLLVSSLSLLLLVVVVVLAVAFSIVSVMFIITGTNMISIISCRKGPWPRACARRPRCCRSYDILLRSTGSKQLIIIVCGLLLLVVVEVFISSMISSSSSSSSIMCICMLMFYVIIRLHSIIMCIMIVFYR